MAYDVEGFDEEGVKAREQYVLSPKRKRCCTSCGVIEDRERGVKLMACVKCQKIDRRILYCSK